MKDTCCGKQENCCQNDTKIKTEIRVCVSRSCTSFGADSIMQKISEALQLEPGQTNEQFDLDYCGCLGYCSNSPNVLINQDHIIHDAAVDTVMSEIKKGGKELENRILDVENVDEKVNVHFDDYLEK